MRQTIDGSEAMAFVKPDIKGKEIQIASAFYVRQEKKRDPGVPAMLASLVNNDKADILATAYAPAEPDYARASPFASVPPLEEDLSEKLQEGMRIRLHAEAAGTRPEAVLRFHFADAETGSPVTDLQPYLGAAGHVLIVSPDLTNSVHAHPDANGSGPDLAVHAAFPQAGVFKLWVQVQRRGRVVSAPFTVRIGP